MTTLTQSRDTINGLVKTGFDAQPTVDVVYEGVVAPSTDGQTPQVRVYIRHNAGGQDTLGRAGSGTRSFLRVGQVILQVFSPFGDGFTLDDTLVTVARNCFEGVTANGVWFRRVAIKEIGKAGRHYQTNVHADFEYTERR